MKMIKISPAESDLGLGGVVIPSGPVSLFCGQIKGVYNDSL